MAKKAPESRLPDGFKHHAEQEGEFREVVHLAYDLRLAIFETFIGFPEEFDWEKFKRWCEKYHPADSIERQLHPHKPPEWQKDLLK